MTMKDDGGPAFPQNRDSGMTLRDWFAGQYLQGRIASGADIPAGAINDGETVAGWMARQAYAAADALLEARK